MPMPMSIVMLFTIAAMITSTIAGAAEKPRARPSPGEVHGADSYLRYAHPTIREPLVDLLNLGVPAELAAQPLAALGYVDVTGKTNHSATRAAPLAVVVLLFYLQDMLSAQTQEHWPQFRGPEARGVASGPNLPDRWSASENIAWKTDVPGRAWSSPIVWGSRVFLTTAVNSGELETPKKGLYFGGNRPEPREVRLDYKVLCLDLPSGKMLWERSVHQGSANSPIHLKNSFASETPVTDGERVYAYFGNQGLYCLDLDGNLLWSRRLEPRATRNGWGTAASPVLQGDRLVILNDNDEESYLLCLDKRTGNEVWRVVRDEKSNWSTPFPLAK